MYAIYAFCREVDDIADGQDRPEVKMGFLEKWRTEVKQLYAGNPNHLISQALAGPVKDYGLAKEDFIAVIDGMEMDAVDELRIKDMAELELYCDRVAGAVGRLSNQVFGLTGDKNSKLAKSLGDALQLTNILRDIEEDAERNHLYLPADLLTKHGISDSSIDAIATNPALVGLCLELAEIAKKRYHQADEIINSCDKPTIRPAIIMKNIYHRLFECLELRGWERLDIPVKLSKFDKLQLAAKAWLR